MHVAFQFTPLLLHLLRVHQSISVPYKELYELCKTSTFQTKEAKEDRKIIHYGKCKYWNCKNYKVC